MRALWIILILFGTCAVAQEAKTETKVAPILEILARVNVTDSTKINPFPDDYNWNKDARRAEALKRTVVQTNYWDCQMRELPPDAYRSATLEAAYRTMTK